MHVKSVLVVVAAYAMVAEANAVKRVFKSIFKREIVMRGTNDIWERNPSKQDLLLSSSLSIYGSYTDWLFRVGGASEATSDITKAFPKCEAVLDKLPGDKKPYFTNEAGSVNFIKVPKECIDEATALKGKKIEGTTFLVKGDDIVVTHPDPDVLKVFESHFGFLTKAESPSGGKWETWNLFCFLKAWEHWWRRKGRELQAFWA